MYCLDFCVDYIETGKYISPEFRLGHVYDGNENGGGMGEEPEDDVILYRPVYVKVVDKPRVIDKITKELMESRLSESPSSFLYNAEQNNGGDARLASMETLTQRHSVSDLLNGGTDEAVKLV